MMCDGLVMVRKQLPTAATIMTRWKTERDATTSSPWITYKLYKTYRRCSIKFVRI